MPRTPAAKPPEYRHVKDYPHYTAAIQQLAGLNAQRADLQQRLNEIHETLNSEPDISEEGAVSTLVASTVELQQEGVAIKHSLKAVDRAISGAEAKAEAEKAEAARFVTRYLADEHKALVDRYFTAVSEVVAAHRDMLQYVRNREKCGAPVANITMAPLHVVVSAYPAWLVHMRAKGVVK